jgi:hypothetical protein
LLDFKEYFMNTTPILIEAKDQLAIYSPVLRQLAEISELNNSLVFDYSSKQGEKEARSHVYKLKKFKTIAEKARKDATADARAYTSQVNETGKTVLERIEAMIDVHMEPIRIKEAREAAREQGIKAKIDAMRDAYDSWMTSAKAFEVLEQITASVIDEATYQEYLPVALRVKEDAIAKLSGHVLFAKEREKKEADALKAEEEAKYKAIQEKAKADAELAVQTELAEAKRKEALALAQAEQASKMAKNAQLAAENAIREEQAKKASEELARAKDTEHRRKTNWNAVNALVSEASLEESVAKEVVKAIINGKIPGVKLTY